MVGPFPATQGSSAHFRPDAHHEIKFLIIMNRNRLALAAALAGLFASSQLRAEGSAATPATDKPAAEKHGCSGKDGCAGKAGCGAKDKASDKEKASCSGKDGCAGKDKPADKEKASCSGKEGCAGKDKPKA